MIIHFLGDSITEGWGASAEDKPYIRRFQKEFPTVTIKNYGRWGTRIARQKEPSKELCMDNDFVMRVDEMDDDADMVVVFGGTNDFMHGDAVFGEIGDKTEWSFCGAVALLFEKLQAKFPEAKIIVMTPTHRTNEKYVNAHGKCLSDYVEAIKLIAKQYSLFVVDLFVDSVFSGDVAKDGKSYLFDSVHPNDDGHYKIFEALKDFVVKEKLIVE